MSDSDIRRSVRERYGTIAAEGSPCCSPSAGSTGCGCQTTSSAAEETSRAIGYSDEDLGTVPEGANLGLGCGNPTALASLEPGDVVLDLGSGAGFDVFLAAPRVLPDGRVIGVDMTPEMLERARENARAGGFENVEFRLGEIEHLPVSDGSIDVTISNCVVNLSPDKPQVFREVYRVLRPGGRLVISDIVLTGQLPQPILTSLEAYVGCIAGASLLQEYLDELRKAGFSDVQVLSERTFQEDDGSLGQELLLGAAQLDIERDEAVRAAQNVASVTVQAFRPE